MSVNPYQRIPSLDVMLQRDDVDQMVSQYGRVLVRDSLRSAIQSFRDELAQGTGIDDGTDVAATLAARAQAAIAVQQKSAYRRVFNLTGTILHTNLGRAPLPVQAIEAIAAVAGFAATVEYDLARGERGERDEAVEALLVGLTGAEAATVVNNNAAAVMLSLNTLAAGREVIVSRGELVEIGGAFRMPDIMVSSGCVLREIGTTNRTHLHDYESAISDATGALMTVHPSNFQIQGFSSRAAAADIATLAHQRGLPLIDDLGSGSLLSLQTFGLPHEATVTEALQAGADVVTFSGDKLLGGPQCGLVVGRREFIEKIRRNPMKRALRVDKLTLVALEAVLRLYQSPDKLTEHLPALRQLTREPDHIAACADRIRAALERKFSKQASFAVIACQSQIGSGALPVDLLDSFAVAITPTAGLSVEQWASALRRLPIPIIGRIHAGRLLLDMRTLEDEEPFLAQLDELDALPGEV